MQNYRGVNDQRDAKNVTGATLPGTNVRWCELKTGYQQPEISLVPCGGYRDPFIMQTIDPR
jgi:hypothetical protein